MTFNDFKEQFTGYCKEASACTSEFKRVLEADNFQTLFTIIKDNWWWCCKNIFVKHPELMEGVKDGAKESSIFINEDAVCGYLLASGNCTVRASGNCMVRAYDNCTVRASGNCTVEAYGNCTVEAFDNCTVHKYGNNKITLNSLAVCQNYTNNTIEVKKGVEVVFVD